MELVMKAAALLLLLLSCEAAEEECGLKGRVSPQHLDKVLGVRWVLVSAFSDYGFGLDLLKNAQSSVMVLEMMEDNVTVTGVERNMVHERCLVFHINMTRPAAPESNHTLVLKNAGLQANDSSCVSYDDQSRADIYSTCDDCMLIQYHMTFNNEHCRMLLIYRREGNHTDSEELKASEEENMEMAKCLKFNMDYHFTYNGTAAFCEKNIVDQGDGCFLA